MKIRRFIKKRRQREKKLAAQQLQVRCQRIAEYIRSGGRNARG